MTKQEINKRVREIVTDKLGCSNEDATDIANFKDDLGGDSLDCIEVIMEIESSFSTTIPDEEWVGLDTISKITEYLHERLSFV